jgi:hypothetical protein
MPNVINVTACDNELIILAYQESASYELCRILSGNFNTVAVTLNIQEGQYVDYPTINGVNNPINETKSVTIPAGEYQLLLLGIDWGGPAAFTVNVNGNAYTSSQPHGKGLVFNPGPIQLTV